MHSDIKNQILNTLAREIDEFGSQESHFEIKFSPTGNISSQGHIIIDSNKKGKFLPRGAESLIKSFYEDVINDLNHRFNKVTIDSINNSTIIKYDWDEVLIKDNQLEGAQIFPQWLNERMMSLIYEQEFPNGPTEKDEDGDPLYVSTWDNGVFVFSIGKNKKINSRITLYKNNNSRNLNIELPEYITDAIMQHYEMTNSGILKNDWKPWNKLEIRSPHNTLPHGKRDEHIFYTLE